VDPVAVPPPVDLRQLRHFIAVAEERSFTRAARRLHIAQQALSVTIRQLETQLGVMLLDRSGRQLELTEAGRVLLVHGRHALATVQQAAELAMSAGGRLAGTLTIGCSYDSQHAVAEGFAHFRERWPDVELEISLLLDPSLTDGLRAGRLDGVVNWDLDAERADLASVAISEEDIVALLPAGHRLARQELVSRAALAQEPLVLFDREIAPGVFDRLVGQLSHAAPVPSSVTFADAHVFVSGQEAMIDRVRRGHGVTLITRRVFDRLRPAGIVARPIDPPMFAGIVVAWVDPPKLALRALVDLLTGGPAAGPRPVPRA